MRRLISALDPPALTTFLIIVKQCTEFRSSTHLPISSARHRSGIPRKLITVTLYRDKISEEFQIQNGICQSCILSPIIILFVINDAFHCLSGGHRGVQWTISRLHWWHPLASYATRWNPVPQDGQLVDRLRVTWCSTVKEEGKLLEKSCQKRKTMATLKGQTPYNVYVCVRFICIFLILSQLWSHETIV